MALTVTQALSRIRTMLDESSASRWSDTQIREWINDALDDLSRVTLAIRDDVSISSVASTAEYTVSSSVLQIEAAYWTDGSGNLRPLYPVAWENADEIWGQWQNQESSDPSVFTVWGYAPNLKLRLYPVPNVSRTNAIKLKVARIATHVNETGAADSSPIDCPEAWVTAMIHFAESRALRRDRDQRWQEAQRLYEAERDSLLRHDYMNATRSVVYDPAVTGGIPRWLADPRWR